MHLAATPAWFAANLAPISLLSTCECQLAGQDVTVPVCDPDTER